MEKKEVIQWHAIETTYDLGCTCGCDSFTIERRGEITKAICTACKTEREISE